jgi:hypothetical protein
MKLQVGNRYEDFMGEKNLNGKEILLGIHFFANSMLPLGAVPV